ncbi:ABC transporter permease [Teredinibacter turnerae]|uniref:Oligopeptide transport system permease protein OppC n=1 Tax=Teredinibacter turnerae (strain ATCC 39867 / T7901) TaxID=377629 RepID=C5BJ98_TERTT|nr:ABC transporter permease [Teredinibacter turnerae]ACR13084.1 oligopeptide transport system permease protein OppC [Teredinibacter turnerae T7901]
MIFKSSSETNDLESYEAGRSLSQDAFVRLKRNKLAMAGMIFLIIIISLAILTPWIAPYSYEAQNLDLGATPPSAEHWMGTDIFGRDQLTRILYGSRISLMVGFIATAVALLIGVLWGTIAGYSGGKVDSWMMRIVDVLYALPFTIFIILLTVIFGRSIFLLFLAIGAVEWLTMARIVRGQVMALKHQEFVEAAVSMGLSRWQIMTRHLIPNILGPVIVYTTLTIPGVILLESFLSFLGLGIQPPQSSWGSLISYGVETIEEYPWLLIYPSLFLSITLFALNFLGDGLRDAFDPRTSKD